MCGKNKKTREGIEKQVGSYFLLYKHEKTKLSSSNSNTTIMLIARLKKILGYIFSLYFAEKREAKYFVLVVRPK